MWGGGFMASQHRSCPLRRLFLDLFDKCFLYAGHLDRVFHFFPPFFSFLFPLAPHCHKLDVCFSQHRNTKLDACRFVLEILVALSTLRIMVFRGVSLVGVFQIFIPANQGNKNDWEISDFVNVV